MTQTPEIHHPLTFQTLTGNSVVTDPFALFEDAKIGHIALADLAELIVILPQRRISSERLRMDCR